jgi:hypothetical protein
MATEGARSWRELCQAASHEQDPRKLLELLREINHALVEQRATKLERLADA